MRSGPKAILERVMSAARIMAVSLPETPGGRRAVRNEDYVAAVSGSGRGGPARLNTLAWPFRDGRGAVQWSRVGILEMPDREPFFCEFPDPRNMRRFRAHNAQGVFTVAPGNGDRLSMTHPDGAMTVLSEFEPVREREGVRS